MTGVIKTDRVWAVIYFGEWVSLFRTKSKAIAFAKTKGGPVYIFGPDGRICERIAP